jgi:hypothetical protein
MWSSLIFDFFFDLGSRSTPHMWRDHLLCASVCQFKRQPVWPLLLTYVQQEQIIAQLP